MLRRLGVLFSGGLAPWILCALLCAPISILLRHVRVFEAKYDRHASGEVTNIKHEAGRKPGTGPGKTGFDVVDFRFHDEGGAEREGTSYSDPMQLQPGAKVQIEYVGANPSSSRIVGTESLPGTPLFLLV